jgi:uncharacterized protein YdiU (UPF0061 family)
VTVGAPTSIAFDDSYARELPELARPWPAAIAPAPRVLVVNDDLAVALGFAPAWLRTPAGLGLLTGNALPDGVTPVAQAYAGHQFGGYSPRLGDGRALLLGELVDEHGDRRDLHLKGSGRTPFARGGDGKAAVGPMLREFAIGEAMHALGVPTTRALAVVASGEDVVRETVLPGAILARIASSHIRVGTFQYASALDDPSVLTRLADHAIARHHPAARDAPQPYLALFESVLEAQAALIARWMLVGFIHGVMNTDNMTISGETIDYGPCAFMDAFDPATVFSSIDHGGRYAYGNQPVIAQWNLARLAEAMLPLLGATTDAAVEAATAVLQTFPERYSAHWRAGWRAKLGLAAASEIDGDDQLADEWFGLLQAQRVDLTAAMRSLSSCLTGHGGASRRLFSDPEPFEAWRGRWVARLGAEGLDGPATAAAMDAVNPVYVPRNHLVEEALAAATAGDLDPFERLVRVVSRPFDARPGFERFAEPAPPSAERYQTFCGT